MMRLLTILCFSIFYSCFGQATREPDRFDDNKFEKYIDSFKSMSLPIVLDRKNVFDLSKVIYDTLEMKYKMNLFSIFCDEHEKYIPRNLKNNHPTNNFRYLFALQSKDNISPLIIAKDYFREGEQFKLKIFLICYDRRGKVLGYEEIAGYNIDIQEKFAEITEDFRIISKDYVFEEAPENRSPNLFYLSETERVYDVNENGEIIKLNSTSKIGYYKGDWKGYHFVK